MASLKRHDPPPPTPSRKGRGDYEGRIRNHQPEPPAHPSVGVDGSSFPAAMASISLTVQSCG
jgi:hypothetical protein